MYHQGEKAGSGWRTCEAQDRVVISSLLEWCSVKAVSTVSNSCSPLFQNSVNFFFFPSEKQSATVKVVLVLWPMQRGYVAAYVCAPFLDVFLFLVVINVYGCGLSFSLSVLGQQNLSCNAAFCHADLFSGCRVRWAGDGRLPGTEAVVPLCSLCPACFSLLPVIVCLPPDTISISCPFSPCSDVRKNGAFAPQLLSCDGPKGPVLVMYAKVH